MPSAFPKVDALVKGAVLEHRALPTAPDGDYEPAEQNPKDFIHAADRIRRQLARGNPLGFLATQAAFDGFVDAATSKLEGRGVDDRKHLFETGVDALTTTDPQDHVVKTLNDVIVSGMYQKLPHPAHSYVGPRDRFRSADGSSNNPYWPKLGKAGEPYSRSVPGVTPLPEHELPDPGLIFDTLLKRRDDPNPEKNIHANGNSSLTFAYASLVTHMLFRTDPKRPYINQTSSYLDLSCLYGCNEREQNEMRIVNGRGRIHPDTFSEERITHLPPAAAALLIIFNRNHNYTADMLLEINENGRWKDPKAFPEDDPDRSKQDNEIFQTSRLINCGHFMSMIFGDYVAGFLGNTRNGKSWHMKPFGPIVRQSGEKIGRGEGNHVSVEFNLLYRWHACISKEDEAWSEEALGHIFRTRDWESIDVHRVEDVLGRYELRVDHLPSDRDIFRSLGIKRQADKTYRDEDLAKILQDATASAAHRYGARATPACLRPIEMMTIIEARNWGVCTMNEFRDCMGLKRFESFEQWNSDKDIADAARQLYGHINKLELYAGLQAEELMKMTYASGFCCGYTTMHAILIDAICLVRGDRFYCQDFTPQNLTAWGYNDVQPVNDNGAWGSCLPKLILRHLPQDYEYNSVYGLFPMFTPKKMQEFLSERKIVHLYNTNRPRRNLVPVTLNTMKAIQTVFSDPDRFKVPYTNDMKYLTQGYGMFLVFDDRKKHDEDRRFYIHSLWADEKVLDKFADFYKATTARLINEHSFRYDVGPNSNSPYKGKYVDIVRNVVNLTSVHWATEYITGLSLKTKRNPHGMFTEQEAYQLFMVLFMCVFENVSPEHSWFLRTKAKQAADALNGIIESSICQTMSSFRGWIAYGGAVVSGTSIRDKPCYPFLRKLVKSGRSLRDLTAGVMGLAVGSCCNYAQACAQVVDFYLDDERAKERAEIVRLVARDDQASNDLLVGYIKEAQRLAPQFPGLTRQYDAGENGDKEIKIEQGNGKPPVVVQDGQKVVGSYYNAQTDPHDFPDPFVVNPRRPRKDYAVQGIGFHGCPGVNYAERTLAAQIRAIFSLKNLRRAPTQQGSMKSFDGVQDGTKMRFYVDSNGSVSPWPGSLMVVYDD